MSELLMYVGSVVISVVALLFIAHNVGQREGQADEQRIIFDACAENGFVARRNEVIQCKTMMKSGKVSG